MNEALEKSIVHWIEIRDGVELLRNCGTSNCGLCEIYYNSEDIISECKDCPLSECGDNCNNKNSTWRKYRKILASDLVSMESWKVGTMSTITPAQRAILYPLSDNMVKKLESLR